jgi:hypothetical protein
MSPSACATGNPAVVSRAPNHLDVFITGNDGRVYTSAWTDGMAWNGLNGWFDIGGVFPVGAPVSAVSRAPDHLDLFVVGNNGRVYMAVSTPVRGLMAWAGTVLMVGLTSGECSRSVLQ